MTVYGSFDLEDDDIFDDTFRSISDAELTNHAANVLSECLPTNHKSDQTSTDARVKKNDQDFACSTSVNQNLNYKVNNSFPDVDNKQSSQICEKVTTDKSFPGFYENKESNQIHENLAADKAVPCTPKNVFSVSTEETAINLRFTPGFTSKVKKRKIPGLDDVFYEKSDNSSHYKESNHFRKKKIEEQDITNSQFSADDLLLPSWQNLQADVSSKHTLSTAKYYSIHRVYHETSKKKLPKHLVVPVLCVLLKKFNQEKAHYEFIDDTGEIPGKIDKEVLVKFEEYLMDGVALILKKVTFVCNVLLLTQQSIVSIYLTDGTVKHIQEMDSVPCREEPLKLMSCQCPAEKATRNPFSSSESPAIPQGCSHGTTDNAAGSLSVPKTHQVIEKNPHSPSTSSSKCSKENFTKSVPSTSCIQPSFTSVPSGSKMASNVCDGRNSLNSSSDNDFSVHCNMPKTEQIISDNSNQKNKQAHSIQVTAIVHSSETNIFGDNSDFDEFDALLGTLDEKSFLEEF